MALRYTRVKDKATGHEYDVLAHKFNPEKHTRVDRKHYPDVSRPRPAKPNVKGKRSAAANADDTGGASASTGGDPS
ncbi:hypothetical protein Q9R08_05205 [Microbacterium sp. QXD-8]|uniref:Uncharacterized protein n=1 Tax=Microbacterium psychrotolerans TaxID=3068321 RepID=A0ABU0YYG6_9MICO|nr:hypothetical protein [Microbacterium sp. QXD-8]MDQ7877371.1 hypothetical protein [Microbacterium sp. QXD-8]